MQLSITPLYLCIFILFYLSLGLYVVKGRLQFKVGLGDGEQKDLRKRVRIHANFAENIPFALIILLVLELQGTAAGFLHFFGSLLFVSRLLHLIGLTKSSGASKPRFFGTLITWTLLMVGSIYGLYQSLS